MANLIVPNHAYFPLIIKIYPSLSFFSPLFSILFCQSWVLTIWIGLFLTIQYVMFIHRYHVVLDKVVDNPAYHKGLVVFTLRRNSHTQSPTWNLGSFNEELRQWLIEVLSVSWALCKSWESCTWIYLSWNRWSFRTGTCSSVIQMRMKSFTCEGLSISQRREWIELFHVNSTKCMKSTQSSYW